MVAPRKVLHTSKYLDNSSVQVRDSKKTLKIICKVMVKIIPAIVVKTTFVTIESKASLNHLKKCINTLPFIVLGKLALAFIYRMQG
jgi:hypothetical protein